MENLSVERMNQRRGRWMDSLMEGNAGKVHKEHPCQSKHSAQAQVHMYSCPMPSLPPEIKCIHQESHPPFPASHALVSFLDIIPLCQGSFVAAVKTETFYGVYKPEVTQLNETICHIKFTSAGIKRQIT